MNYQQILNTFFARHKLSAECIEVNHIQHFIYAKVRLFGSTKISKLSSLCREIGLELKLSEPVLRSLSSEGLIELQFASQPQAFYLSDYRPTNSPPKDFNLPALIGQDERGRPAWIDISTNPHLLIAGTTGSGKSILLHNLIANLLQVPQVKIYLSDPKRVEFEIYKRSDFNARIPMVVNSYHQTTALLRFLLSEMESRYAFLADFGVANLWQVPRNIRPNSIIVVLDEIGDLLLQDESKELEKVLIRLAQKARAAGIYLIAATQRPSVDVITGVIKANFPARIACRVGSSVDSRVILGVSGAEKLLGKGDAYFMSPTTELTRLQIAYHQPN